MSNQLRVEWSARSPDGSRAFEIMHGFNWQLQGTQIQVNPCPVQPFDSARAFFQAVVQQRRAGTQATNDRIQRRTLEGIGQYNTFRGADGTPVRSSIHGGARVLQHPDGSHASTDDPYYNPAGSQQLKRVR